MFKRSKRQRRIKLELECTARGARRVLDGEIELEDFRMESPAQPPVTSARRLGSTPQRASRRRKKRKRRSR
jgi:hypothetical protein